MTHADPVAALERDLSEVAVALFAPGTVDAVLQRVVDEAVGAIEPCEVAGILDLRDGVVTTLASSDALVLELHRLQAELGEGPCLDVASGAATDDAEDLADDARWPRFGPAAAAAGARSVLAFPVGAGRPSALGLYSSSPAAFDVVDRAKALLFATLAGLALGSAEERAAEERRAVNFEAGLRTRELIGQAQGILIERERITPGQAFEVLVTASQHLNVKLRDVARNLVETGETGDRPRPLRAP